MLKSSRLYYLNKIKLAFPENFYYNQIMKEKKSIPSTVKFSLQLQEKIDEAANKTGLPKQEIIRLCAAMGLEDLRKLDWDIPRALSDASDLYK